MKNPLLSLRKNSFAPMFALAVMYSVALAPCDVKAEHQGYIQILLLGDSTTEGSVPRRLKPEGPHLEEVLARNCWPPRAICRRAM